MPFSPRLCEAVARNSGPFFKPLRKVQSIPAPNPQLPNLAPMSSSQKEHRRKAQLAYEQRSRSETQRMESANAGLRLVAEEKEKYRQRQS